MRREQSFYCRGRPVCLPCNIQLLHQNLFAVQYDKPANTVILSEAKNLLKAYLKILHCTLFRSVWLVHLLSYSTAALNLNCSFVFFFKSFFYVLLAAKRTKSPGTPKVQSTFSLLRSRWATSLGQKGVATWTFLLIFGWCGPSSVSHSPWRAPN